jgi:hypothetical protein
MRRIPADSDVVWKCERLGVSRVREDRVVPVLGTEVGVRGS